MNRNYMCDRNGELLSGCKIRQLAGIKELELLPLTTFADRLEELAPNQIRNGPDGPRFIQTRKNQDDSSTEVDVKSPPRGRSGAGGIAITCRMAASAVFFL